MSYLTAFRRPISQAYIWHQNTGFMERSDSFLYSFLPASKENVEINRVKFMVEVDCQSFSGVPLKKKKIQAHNTSQRLYLDYILKGRYAANMQIFHVLCLAQGN